MKDIVERLKGDAQYEWRQIMREAAAEIERLRARVAELEADVKEFQDQSEADGLMLTQTIKERDSWKQEAIEARTWLADQRVSENGHPYETYAERIAQPSYWTARAANEGRTG